jgi:hypothetical protein
MDDKPGARPCFQLILRALPRAVPTVVRLRRLLKAFLRCYGFQCVDACELPRRVGKEDSQEQMRADDGRFDPLFVRSPPVH